MFGLRRKVDDPTYVSWKDISDLREAAIQEGDYDLFERASLALKIAVRGHRYFRECEFEIRRRRLTST